MGGVDGHDMSGVFVCVCICAERASGVGERGNGGTYKMREKGLRMRRS